MPSRNGIDWEAKLAQAVAQDAETDPEDAGSRSLLGGMFSADWLMAQSFPPLEYVVPGLIPEGMSLLVAAPKIGKSWMVLALGVAAASGGVAFGHLRTDQRPVLYLALEDGKTRLQGRLRSLEVTDPPAALHFLTTLPPGLTLATIREFVEAYADDHPLVILDTLGKAMPPAVPNETTYARDYRVTGALKAVVDRVPGSSLIAVHHTRKAETSDFLEAVSGTNGIAGAADTIMVLKRDREASGAILSVTSRDAMEGSYALTLGGNGAWTLNGTTLAEAARAARTAVQTDGLGDRMAELVAYVNAHPDGVRADEVQAALHLKTRDDAGRYLRRATDAGRIERPKLGLYTPVRSVRSVRNLFAVPDESDTSDTSDTPTEGQEDR